MKLDSLARRIKELEARSHQGAVTLSDGKQWVPRISPIETLITLMEFDERPGELPPEIKEEALQWAKYEQMLGEPALNGLVALMAREITNPSALEAYK